MRTDRVACHIGECPFDPGLGGIDLDLKSLALAGRAFDDAYQILGASQGRRTFSLWVDIIGRGLVVSFHDHRVPRSGTTFSLEAVSDTQYSAHLFIRRRRRSTACPR